MIELLIIVQQLIASLTHIIAKSITNDIIPTTVLFIRASIAASVFIIWILIKKSYIIKIKPKDYLKLLLLGFINIPINQFLFLESIKRTTPPNVSLAYALSPVFVFIIAYFYLKEKITVKKAIGITIALLGAIVLLSEKGFNFSSESMKGDILALIASLSWAFYTIFGKNLTRRYGAIYITGLTMIIGFILYIPIFLMMPVQFEGIQISTVNWLQLLYLGAFSSAVGYAIWYYALSKIDASKLSVFNNLQPALTALLAFLFFGTAITEYFVIGGTLILAGVFVTQRG
jgi:drug/metabolite transporter (DMT)-like permease